MKSVTIRSWEVIVPFSSMMTASIMLRDERERISLNRMWWSAESMAVWMTGSELASEKAVVHCVAHTDSAAANAIIHCPSAKYQPIKVISAAKHIYGNKALPNPESGVAERWLLAVSSAINRRRIMAVVAPVCSTRMVKAPSRTTLFA